jgi:hypothetical protein
MHEAHYRLTEGFWANFFRGAKKYGVEVDDFILARYHEVQARRRQSPTVTGVDGEPPCKDQTTVVAA